MTITRRTLLAAPAILALTPAMARLLPPSLLTILTRILVG